MRQYGDPYQDTLIESTPQSTIPKYQEQYPLGGTIYKQ